MDQVSRKPTFESGVECGDDSGAPAIGDLTALDDSPSRRTIALTHVWCKRLSWLGGSLRAFKRDSLPGRGLPDCLG